MTTFRKDPAADLTSEIVAAQSHSDDYIVTEGLDAWTRGLGRRVKASNSVAALTLREALMTGQPITTIMKMSPHPWDPVTLTAIDFNWKIDIKIMDPIKFWFKYRQTVTKHRPLDEAEQLEADESKQLILTSIDALRDFNINRLNKTSLWAIRQLHRAVDSDAGAVFIVRVPADRDEMITFEFYPFETKLRYKSVDKH